MPTRISLLGAGQEGLFGDFVTFILSYKTWAWLKTFFKELLFILTHLYFYHGTFLLILVSNAIFSVQLYNDS